MDVQVKMNNLARYKRRLRALPNALAARGARAASINAKELERAAERDVPVDTATTRATIKAFPAKGTFGTVWRVVAGVRGGDGFQARYIEFGTVNQQAEPFFFPNYRALRPRFKRRMGRAMSEAAKDVKRAG